MNLAVLVPVLVILTLISLAISMIAGPVPVSPLAILDGSADAVARTIFFEIRLPRSLMALSVGASLALAGTAMQGLFRNPMADPYILGISSGAAFGAALSIVTGVFAVFGSAGTPIGAFIGAAVTIAVVYSLARTNGQTPTETLLLAGIAVGFFLQAGVSFLKLIANDQSLRDVVLWLMGSLSSARWSDVVFSVTTTLFGGVTLLCFGTHLNAFQCGEDTAAHLGVSIEKTKVIILAITVLLTAVTVSLCGIIGFVGLVVPHALRFVVGGNYRRLLPLSMITGGIFILLADAAARTISPSMELPIGIITALTGAPYFIWLMKRRKKAVEQ